MAGEEMSHLRNQVFPKNLVPMLFNWHEMDLCGKITIKILASSSLEISIFPSTMIINIVQSVR